MRPSGCRTPGTSLGRFWYSREESEEAEDDGWADMAAVRGAACTRSRSASTPPCAPCSALTSLPLAAFFVGFAGQGDQRVFAGEIALARKVVAAKFGSAQRSVLLVNDRRDLETLAACKPNRAALRTRRLSLHACDWKATCCSCRSRRTAQKTARSRCATACSRSTTCRQTDLASRAARVRDQVESHCRVRLLRREVHRASARRQHDHHCGSRGRSHLVRMLGRS